MRDLLEFLGVYVGILVVGIGTIGGVITGLDYYASKKSCAAFERETGRQTKYVKTAPLSWTCFARTSDGKWLPREQLRDVAP